MVRGRESHGTLYIVPTPIGNMEDMTLRSLRILKEEIDELYCEDTRRTGKVLAHHGISCKLQSLHANSGDRKLTMAVEKLLSGKNLGYATDAGTPGISDPGGKLVSLCHNDGIPVIPLPGPSALTALASASGGTGKEIVFLGFLSKKKNKRKEELTRQKGTKGIIIIYESPYRIKALLEDINEIYPDKVCTIGREMSKIYEEFLHGRASDLLTAGFTEKGEFAVAILNN